MARAPAMDTHVGSRRAFRAWRNCAPAALRITVSASRPSMASADLAIPGYALRAVLYAFLVSRLTRE
jgi:hypothetical protein